MFENLAFASVSDILQDIHLSHTRKKAMKKEEKTFELVAITFVKRS